MTQRDSLEIEALVADRYLDSLLAARDRRAADAPADATLDPEVRDTARLLEAQLGRVHPSFRFEERLANELHARAARLRNREGRLARATAWRRSDRAVPVQLRTQDPEPDAVTAAPPRLDAAGARRPLIIGGALTSAALSIAGAYVAWRRGRPPVNPMVRAVRAAHRSGLTRRVARRSARLAHARTGPRAG